MKERSSIRSLVGVALIISGLALIIGIAWGGADEPAPKKKVKPVSRPSSSPKEMAPVAKKPTDTAFAPGVFPESISNSSSSTKDLYEFAADSSNQDLLQAQPCYCGCGNGVGHKNLLDCYIKEFLPDHRIIYDEHALRCRMCFQEARDTRIWFQEGKTPEQIRRLISSKYGPP